VALLERERRVETSHVSMEFSEARWGDEFELEEGLLGVQQTWLHWMTLKEQVLKR
jgi:hypothetical protein